LSGNGEWRLQTDNGGFTHVLRTLNTPPATATDQFHQLHQVQPPILDVDAP
jgi:hypothetical protein